MENIVTTNTKEIFSEACKSSDGILRKQLEGEITTKVAPSEAPNEPVARETP